MWPQVSAGSGSADAYSAVRFLNEGVLLRSLCACVKIVSYLHIRLLSVRIGISVITHANQNIWENGAGQNVIFLAQALRQLPFVRSVVLIDVGDQGVMPAQVHLDALELQLLKQDQATDAVDVIIELAGALDPRWLALQRARGRKVVYYSVGQPMGLFECSVFDKPAGFPVVGRCDEVWLLPKDKAFIAMLRTMNRCPVQVAPYLWSPVFVRQRIDEVKQHGHSYGWSTRANAGQGHGLRVAIFEPNLSVVKTSMTAMLACDEAYRSNPGSIDMMHALNTVHMKDHPTLLYLANSLNLVQQHKACFHGRNDIVGFMAQHADAVVSHQWANDQNYLYLDALYGDYPLVHNSPWLASYGAGYYYPGFEAAQGGRQILAAWAEHDVRLPDQRRAAKAVFDAVNPLAEANVREYADLIRHLCHDAPQLLEG